MTTGRHVATLPNAISIFRIATAPALLLAAAADRPDVFLLLFALGSIRFCCLGILSLDLFFDVVELVQ